ncbi:MAG: proline dehydrogenase family protein [Gammaproteobacteria bacterium]|jgi:proline dehydrogenase|nr:proline dehydrogenase family protein [Gammaproteobacteria bacterium]MDH3750047.1 proline dehydrogenase family protein [Gammaproteobacteria bacterium]
MSANIFHHALIGAMPFVPRPLIWRFSRRYIAGTHLQDACQAVGEMNAAGCSGTIDVLGEDSSSEEQVQAAVDLYLETIHEIHAASLNCGISVKLSELGLRFDVECCKEAMLVLLSAARERDLFVRIDMEDSSVTSVTLDIYQNLRNQFDNVGIVIQSCLRRSEQDIAELLRGGPTDVRLCKGIYIEPEEIAFCEPDEIRDSFSELLEQLFEGGARRVGIATHDPILVARAEESLSELDVGKEHYEFQMLLGVAGTLRRKLVKRGHALRVYVPFGELWYDYSIRRLRENPHIAGHIVRNLLSRG